MVIKGYVKADIILTHGFFLSEDEKEQQIINTKIFILIL